MGGRPVFPGNGHRQADPVRPKSAHKQTSLFDCLSHHTFDVSRFGVGISLAIRLVFGCKSSLDLLVNPNFLWMRAQIVSERRPLPHLSMRLRHMHMVGAPRSKG